MCVIEGNNETHTGTPCFEKLPLCDWTDNARLPPRRRARDTIGRFSGRHMNSMTLVKIVSGDTFILDKLDLCLFVLLLVVLDTTNRLDICQNG